MGSARVKSLRVKLIPTARLLQQRAVLFWVAGFFDTRGLTNEHVENTVEQIQVFRPHLPE